MACRRGDRWTGYILASSANDNPDGIACDFWALHINLSRTSALRVVFPGRLDVDIEQVLERLDKRFYLMSTLGWQTVAGHARHTETSTDKDMDRHWICGVQKCAGKKRKLLTLLQSNHEDQSSHPRHDFVHTAKTRHFANQAIDVVSPESFLDVYFSMYLHVENRLA